MPRDGGSSGSTELARVDAEPISLADIAALRKAVLTLEHPSLAARLARLAGIPLNVLTHALPAEATSVISKAITVALKTAIRVAFATLPHENGDSAARIRGSNS